MDLVSDRLFDERPFRVLTVVDCPTRVALAIAPLVEVLDRLARERGKPGGQRVDNGPEFAGRMLDQLTYLNGVEIDFSRPGKPTDTDVVE